MCNPMREMMKLINFTDQYGGGSFAKKKLSVGSVTKLSVSSVPKAVTKEDIRHAFDEHGQVEVALVKNKRTGQQQDIMGRTTTNISKGRGQGVDRSSGEQGRSQGSVLGSSDTVGLKSNQQHTLMSSPIEEGSDGDGDDVSSCCFYKAGRLFPSPSTRTSEP
ncbi:putative nucleotide-binding alpha-beta plait domain superfamily, RNA-binding domain superfamily [Helianthus annuus]|nr:putative nucleotide-binding alpha-beta plait domain superfamily, RNA-binding domain superfamily [Helianthus annuus]